MRIIEAEKLIKFKYPVGAYLNRNAEAFNNISDVAEDIIPFRANVNLWVMGSSGNIIATYIAMRLLANRKTVVRICNVNKKGVHGNRVLPEYGHDAFNVIVDDFMFSGYTIRAIMAGMLLHGKRPDAIILTGEHKGTTIEKLRIQANAPVMFIHQKTKA